METAKDLFILFSLILQTNRLRLKKLAKTKVSKNKIDKIEILKLTRFVAVLSGGRVDLLDPGTLVPKNHISKSGATNFAINATDSLAIAHGKKIQLFNFDLKTAQFIAMTIGKSNEIAVGDVIIKVGNAYY